MTDRIRLQQLSRHWTPPGGLDRSRPREVMLTPGGRALASFSVAMLVFSLAAVTGLELIAGRERRTARLFEVEGRDAEAVVTRLWRAHDEDRQPWIAFRFRVGEREFERQAPLRYRSWRRLRTGSGLTVRYLPSDPRAVHPRNNPPRPMPVFIPITVGLGLLAAGVAPPLVIGRQRRLLSEGRAAHALVTRHSRGQHGRTVVHYEFATLGGTIAMGRCEDRKPAATGSTLCVLYDSENPRVNAPYPLPLVKPVHGPLREWRVLLPLPSAGSRSWTQAYSGWRARWGRA